MQLSACRKSKWVRGVIESILFDKIEDMEIDTKIMGMETKRKWELDL
jgi:hypothetical protein